MDQLKAMKIFVRAVDTGNFSTVARELNTGQPAISKQIAALEEFLGVRLLNRTSRKLTVTEAGNNYYEHCLNIIASMAEAEELVQSLATTPRGKLRINFSVAFGRLHITPYLTEFLDLYPQITLDISMNDQLIDLVSERVDIAIRIGALADSTIMARYMGSCPFMVVGAPSYFKKHGKPLHPTDLKNHNCLIYTFFPTGSSWPFSDQGEKITVQVGGNYQTDNTEGINDVAVAGTGLAMVPSWMVQAELENKQLESVLDEYMPWTLPIHAVYPMSKYVPLKVRCFSDFIKEKFAQNALFNKQNKNAIGTQIQA